MKKIISLLIVSLFLFGSGRANAQEFFDTSDASQFFTFGARVGFNTSNKNFPSGQYENYMLTSWGIGFNAGVIASLNFKEYLSLQPGFFFESRSGKYASVAEYLSNDGIPRTYYDLGNVRNYNLTIPVMGVVKFNLSDRIQWLVEVGPYIQFCLKQTGMKDLELLYRLPQQYTYLTYHPEHAKFDFGFKMGTGLKVFDHYYVGFHYLAGALNAWTHPSGGRNKSWEFSIGYDL